MISKTKNKRSSLDKADHNVVKEETDFKITECKPLQEDNKVGDDDEINIVDQYDSKFTNNEIKNVESRVTGQANVKVEDNITIENETVQESKNSAKGEESFNSPRIEKILDSPRGEQFPMLSVKKSPCPLKKIIKVVKSRNSREEDSIIRAAKPKHDNYIENKDMSKCNSNNEKDVQAKNDNVMNIDINEQIIESKNLVPEPETKYDDTRNTSNVDSDNKKENTGKNLNSTFKVTDKADLKEDESFLDKWEKKQDSETPQNVLKTKKTKKNTSKNMKLIKSDPPQKPEMKENLPETIKKDKKTSKVKKIKEEISDDVTVQNDENHKNIENSDNSTKESISQSPKKGKRSPMKTKLPLLESRRKRVMKKLIEIDANCKHRPSVNNDSDDVIFIRENSGHVSHCSMTLMPGLPEGSVPESPRDLTYSALSEPCPTLFEDMFDYTGIDGYMTYFFCFS